MAQELIDKYHGLLILPIPIIWLALYLFHLHKSKPFLKVITSTLNSKAYQS